MQFQPTPLIVVLAALATSACASTERAPFHVYRSPLLAGDPTVPEPADRQFDPANPGDYPTDRETVVADSSRDEWDAQPPAHASRTARKAKTKRGGRTGTRPTLAIGGRGEVATGSDIDGQFVPRQAALYVWKTFEINGAMLPADAQADIAALWRTCKKQGKTGHTTPLPGDAVFFHNTFDANSDGRNNDWYTHVGVVETVRKDGAARVMSYVGGAVTSFWVDPNRPDEIGADDAPVNSRVRIPTADDAPYTQYHAGQLFAGYCSVLADRKQVVVMDAWDGRTR